jgi:hypothetical protein
VPFNGGERACPRVGGCPNAASDHWRRRGRGINTPPPLSKRYNLSAEVSHKNVELAHIFTELPRRPKRIGIGFSGFGLD